MSKLDELIEKRTTSMDAYTNIYGGIVQRFIEDLHSLQEPAEECKHEPLIPPRNGKRLCHKCGKDVEWMGDDGWKEVEKPAGKKIEKLELGEANIIEDKIEEKINEIIDAVNFLYDKKM